MGPFSKNTRSDFLQVIRKAYLLSLASLKGNAPSMGELMDLRKTGKQLQSRRSFMHFTAKAAGAAGIAAFMQACTKGMDTVPAIPTKSFHSVKQNLKPRIAIIGGGIAGLSCAYELKRYGFPSTVYEASDRTGGRILSKKNFIGDSLVTECGGEFIDTRHRNMMKLVAEFNLPLIDTLSAGEKELDRDSFYIDGIFYSEEDVIAAFSPFAKRIAADITSLPNYFGYDDFTPDVLRFDQMSISGYFDHLGMPASGFLRKGIEMAYVTEYGMEADEQTAINFLYLFYINPGNSSFDIFGLSDERYKVSGGNERIINSLFEALQENIVLGAELTSISKNNVNVYTLNFKGISSVEADIVVMTLPFSVLRNVDLSKLSLPLWKRNAIANLGYGTNAKLIMGFRERTWRNYGHSGYIFTNGSSSFPSAYIQTGWDSSQLQPTENGSYTVYQGGRLGSELSLSQTDIFLSQLDSLWPGTEAQFNGIAKLIHWPSWPLSLGSYSCWRVGQVTTIKGAEYAPVENLFFAGEHTSSFNQGYMEGGAETGMMVAKRIAVKAY